MLVAIKKYKFHTTKTKFCGFIIKLKKFSIDLKKVINKKLLLDQKKDYISY